MTKWKAVPGWEGRYDVSDKGDIRSWYYGRKHYDKPVKRKLKTDKYGYLVFTFNYNGIKKSATIHRLVAMVFLPNPEGYTQVNHIDGNKKNNRVENLEWCSAKKNMNHAYERGLISKEKQSNAQRKRYEDPEQRNRSRENTLRLYSDPAFAEMMKRKRQSPEFRKAISERRKKQKPPTLGRVWVNNGTDEKFVDHTLMNSLPGQWVRGRLKHERRKKS